jgi:hypothetical protein
MHLQWCVTLLNAAVNASYAAHRIVYKSSVVCNDDCYASATAVRGSARELSFRCNAIHA